MFQIRVSAVVANIFVHSSLERYKLELHYRTAASFQYDDNDFSTGVSVREISAIRDDPAFEMILNHCDRNSAALLFYAFLV